MTIRRIFGQYDEIFAFEYRALVLQDLLYFAWIHGRIRATDFEVGTIPEGLVLRWCYNKDCKRVGISREGLEGHFVGLLGMMQPTAELIARLPDIAKSNWKIRRKRIADEKRTLKNRLKENEALNLRAIEALIKGELSKDDLEKFKAANDKSIADMEDQLKALQSEYFTMEQLIADARRSIVNLAKTWLDADLARRQEIQTALFPEGLVFSPDFLFFEPRNHTLMQSVSELVTVLINDGRGERI